jgi:hypothetical protein
MILDKLELKLNEIDFKKANEKYMEYQENMKDIVTHIEQETDTVLGNYLMTYSNIKGPIKTYIKNHKGIKKEIIRARKQLEDLYHDVENNIVDKEKFEAYFKTESDSVLKLNNWITTNVGKAKENLKVFDSLNPKIKEIISIHKDK